jgi:c-di-GMP-binding flagellar brake protein YcgR
MNPPVTNRRRTRRQSAKRMVKLQCQKGTMGLGKNLARQLLDISTDGARLVIGEVLPINQEVILSLELPWQGRPLAVPARIRWCMALVDGAHCVGVVFDKTIPYRDVQEFASLNGS